MEGVHRITIPTPFDIGRVNCYVFTGDVVTVLDPGPATEPAYEELSAGLEDHGFSVSDVTQVLITHPHTDHFGLAKRVVEESGATAVAHGDATSLLSDPKGHLTREQAFFLPFMQSMGVPEQVAETAVSLPNAYDDYREPLAVDRELSDGDRVDTGIELTAVHTPGHAPGSVCFVPPTDTVAFTGDHVLQHISPNPLLTLVPGTETERTRSLPTYLEALEKLREVDAEVGYSGHGDRIPNLDARIVAILDHHEERKDRIDGIIAEGGPMTAYEVMNVMFPDLPATEVFPGMSEVIGHLDLLNDEHRLEITEADGVRYYTSR